MRVYNVSLGAVVKIFPEEEKLYKKIEELFHMDGECLEAVIKCFVEIGICENPEEMLKVHYCFYHSRIDNAINIIIPKSALVEMHGMDIAAGIVMMAKKENDAYEVEEEVVLDLIEKYSPACQDSLSQQQGGYEDSVEYRIWDNVRSSEPAMDLEFAHREYKLTESQKDFFTRSKELREKVRKELLHKIHMQYEASTNLYRVSGREILDFAPYAYKLYEYNGCFYIQAKAGVILDDFLSRETVNVSKMKELPIVEMQM